jgi:hypothetical protein
MHILADFEPPKFRSEGRPAREGASPKGARPCPSARRGWCVTLTFPYDTNCKVQPVQGSWALWAGAIAIWTNFALTEFSEVHLQVARKGCSEAKRLNNV